MPNFSISMYILLLLTLISQSLTTANPIPTPTISYIDTLVAPTPAANYLRYATYLANGTRTYTCNPSSGSNNYTLVDFSYAMYDVDNFTAGVVGRHEFMLTKDVDGGNSIFYTKSGVFTYWVGKTTKLITSPGAGPLDLTLEQELRTEASEPKPLEAGKYDLGVAVYATRFGAVGGNVPADTQCGKKTQTVVVGSSTYYSVWRQVA